MLKIVLRTCDHTNVHKGNRFFDATKQEIVWRCFVSFVRSLERIVVPVTLVIIDDHSSQETLSFFEKVLKDSKRSYSIKHLPERGNNASMMMSFREGLEGSDLVYFVEDDYLHYESAISEMLDAYEFFKMRLGGREVALFPCDDPNNYKRMELCRIVEGPQRPWRTNTHTTCTMFCSQSVVRSFWNSFEQLTYYGLREEVNEETTINRIWRDGGVTLFTPLRSLAFHLQDVPIHEDWKSLWEQNDWHQVIKE